MEELMEGIRVLNTSPVMKYLDDRYIFMILAIIGAFCTSITILFLFEGDGLKSGGICLAISVGILIIGLIGSTYQVDSGQKQYECVIDDSVSFNELCERYDIVEKRGEIYILEDKSIQDDE